jgi:hypothetical protein
MTNMQIVETGGELVQWCCYSERECLLTFRAVGFHVTLKLMRWWESQGFHPCLQFEEVGPATWILGGLLGMSR